MKEAPMPSTYTLAVATLAAVGLSGCIIVWRVLHQLLSGRRALLLSIEERKTTVRHVRGLLEDLYDARLTQALHEEEHALHQYEDHVRAPVIGLLCIKRRAQLSIKQLETARHTNAMIKEASVRMKCLHSTQGTMTH